MPRRDLWGESAFATAELTGALEVPSSLADAQPESLVTARSGGGSGVAVRVGALLRAQAGRRYGERGLRIERRGTDAHAKVALWAVEEGP